MRWLVGAYKGPGELGAPPEETGLPRHQATGSFPWIPAHSGYQNLKDKHCLLHSIPVLFPILEFVHVFFFFNSFIDE